MRPSIQYNVTSQWNGGYVMEVFITNAGTQTIQDYQIGFDLPGTITDVWDGVIADHSGTHYVLQDDDDKNDIAPGETVRFKFKVIDTGEMPSSFSVNGVEATVNGMEATQEVAAPVSLDEEASSEPAFANIIPSENDIVLLDDVVTVGPGITAAELEALIDKAPAGATIQLAAGDYRFDAQVSISRSDITVVGAGSDDTRIVFTDKALANDSHAFYVEGTNTEFMGTLRNDTAEGSNTLTLSSEHGLKVGDTVRIWQDNTQAYFDEIGDTSWQKLNAPLRTSMAQVVSVDGESVTLDRGVHFDFDGGETKVQRIDALENVRLEGFTITYELGTPDNAKFSNTQSKLTDYQAVKFEGTVDSSVNDIQVINGPSTAFEFALSLGLSVDGAQAHGSFNKGSGGNGYAYELRESYDGTYVNLEDSGMRHSVLFASYRSSVGNDIHVKSTDRDINFHGGQDHDNTVHVEQSIRDANADGMSTTLWYNNGGESFGAITEAGANQVTFDYVIGSKRDDVIQGSDDGVYLDGGLGHDELYGGAGDDILTGGGSWGRNLLDGGAGFDIALFNQNFSDYKIRFNDDGSVVVDGSSDDTLIDIEQAIFADGTRLDTVTGKISQGEKPTIPTPEDILSHRNDSVELPVEEEDVAEVVESTPIEAFPPLIDGQNDAVELPAAVLPIEEISASVEFELQSRSSSGYSLAIEITNTSDRPLYEQLITLELPGIDIVKWNGATLVSQTEDIYTIVDNNPVTLKPGQTMRFGFKASGPETVLPTSLSLNGSDLALDTTAMIAGEEADLSLLDAFSQAPQLSDMLAITSNITSSWSSGYVTEVFVENVSDTTISNPSITFELPGTIDTLWNGVYESNDGRYSVSGDDSHSQVIEPGEVWRFSYKAYSKEQLLPQNVTLEGTIDPEVESSPVDAMGTEEADSLIGTDHSDTLYGGLASDTLTGGADADTFIYLSTFESTASGLDIILDFSAEDGDQIDLSGIDANLAIEGDQDFKWLGDDGFTGNGGEIRFSGSILQGDVNGDGIVDLAIQMVGVDNLLASDVVL